MGIFPEMLVCGDITVITSCTKLTHHHAVDQIGVCSSILHGNSYKYFDAKHCFMLNNVQCKISQKLSHFAYSDTPFTC